MTALLQTTETASSFCEAKTRISQNYDFGLKGPKSRPGQFGQGLCMRAGIKMTIFDQ